MDEVKIWSIDDTGEVEELDAKGQMDTEWSFEDTLVKNPDLLMPGLTLVGRQTPTEGGPLDLLGVDSDGKLAVFELKRGTLSRDAVAQIIDYASDLDRMELGCAGGAHIGEIGRARHRGRSRTSRMVQPGVRRSGPGGAEAAAPVPGRPRRRRQDGANGDLPRHNSGMDISLLTFHGFTHQGKTLLAKQVHVEGVDRLRAASARRRKSQAENRARLERRIEEAGVRELFDGALRMFRDNWPQSGTPHWSIWSQRFLCWSQSGRSGQRWSPTICPPWVHLQRHGPDNASIPAAKALCLNEFRRRPVAEIQYMTSWPESRDPNLAIPTEVEVPIDP